MVAKRCANGFDMGSATLSYGSMIQNIEKNEQSIKRKISIQASEL